jgi:hypothetical protein
VVDVLDLQLPLTPRGRWLGRLRIAVDFALRALAARAPIAVVRKALARASRH